MASTIRNSVRSWAIVLVAIALLPPLVSARA